MPVLPESMTQGGPSAPGLSLLFPAGQRPTGDAVADLIEAARATGLLARVSHRAEPEAGWLELLSSGLTFDVRGLAPAPAAELPPADFAFGLDAATALAGREAIELVPSGHIVAGAGLQPILRTMMALAANLALNLPVAAVAWKPARTVMETRHFASLVLNWLAGGAFPALGLTALLRGQDGSMASRGLAFFTGQEMQLEGRADEPPAETAKLAVRVIDRLVREGRVTAPLTIGTGADTLVAEPSQVGQLVLVWRGG
ncbi:hypothetical protein [Novosphingobium soli]|uniref:DUF4261 domain-containing protein n=1 Tax=Novosphingobium soli TaxID=574956 RepID=A0ABV6CST9_9SPHN